ALHVEAQRAADDADAPRQAVGQLEGQVGGDAEAQLRGLDAEVGLDAGRVHAVDGGGDARRRLPRGLLARDELAQDVDDHALAAGLDRLQLGQSRGDVGAGDEPPAAQPPAVAIDEFAYSRHDGGGVDGPWVVRGEAEKAVSSYPRLLFRRAPCRARW